MKAFCTESLRVLPSTLTLAFKNNKQIFKMLNFFWQLFFVLAEKVVIHLLDSSVFRRHGPIKIRQCLTSNVVFPQTWCYLKSYFSKTSFCPCCIVKSEAMRSEKLKRWQKSFHGCFLPGLSCLVSLELVTFQLSSITNGRVPSSAGVKCRKWTKSHWLCFYWRWTPSMIKLKAVVFIKC